MQQGADSSIYEGFTCLNGEFGQAESQQEQNERPILHIHYSLWQTKCVLSLKRRKPQCAPFNRSACTFFAGDVKFAHIFTHANL